MSRREGLPFARLAAEFVVIVLGVLGALAADQWAQDRENRVLEREYLGRLMADVAYDRGEVEFVRDVSLAGREALDSLQAPGFLDRASDAQVVATGLLAANARQIDLSRGTWEELIASGRIALIEDAEVRLALAEYDRFVREILGYWDYADNDFRVWVWERVPTPAMDGFQNGCRRVDAPLSISQATQACDFEVSSEAADEVRAALRSETGQRLMRLQVMLFGGLIDITGVLLERIDALESVLDDAD